MGTLVTIQVVDARMARPARLRRASSAPSGGFARSSALHAVRSGSEAMRLTDAGRRRGPGEPILFEAVRFALAVAEETGGAFDPTVGHRMETRGFNREHRTGRIVDSDARCPPCRQLSRHPHRPGAADRSRCCGR